MFTIVKWFCKMGLCIFLYMFIAIKGVSCIWCDNFSTLYHAFDVTIFLILHIIFLLFFHNISLYLCTLNMYPPLWKVYQTIVAAICRYLHCNILLFICNNYATILSPQFSLYKIFCRIPTIVYHACKTCMPFMCKSSAF